MSEASTQGIEINSGSLNGFTLVRFAHAFETGGGMERLLDDLDRSLLMRNAMTIVRMHIAPDRTRLEEKEEAIGKGRLVLVPLPLPESESLQIAPDEEDQNPSLKERFRDSVLYNPFVWRILRRFVLSRPIPRRSGQVIGAGTKTEEILSRFDANLVMLHFFGAADADEVVSVCRERGIPFCLQNHYANERFLHLSIRKHAELALAVSGMNGLDVPSYLRRKFTNLADGIDTDFFSEIHAAGDDDASEYPVLLLPARVVKPKGHGDLVRAAVQLRERGLRFKIAFAGRVDSSQFSTELKEQIKESNLKDDVLFLGNLSVKELRRWYAKARIVVFPTYHHEGLGRVIVESQAMCTPVVAYATGGVREGIRHGGTGYLVETGDVDGLSRKLTTLLNDVSLCKEMGAAGRDFVSEHYSLSSLASRHEQFYLRARDASQSQIANCLKNG